MILLVIISSCQSKQQEDKLVSTIDSVLQVKATSILENKLTELNGLSEQVIIMEVQTGHIKAMVGLESKYRIDYQSSGTHFITECKILLLSMKKTLNMELSSVVTSQLIIPNTQ